jgi:hypothetical protein
MLFAKVFLKKWMLSSSIEIIVGTQGVISWILSWGSQHRKFDVAIKWLTEFLKYLTALTAQDEEDWFDEQCKRYYIDLTGGRCV